MPISKEEAMKKVLGGDVVRFFDDYCKAIDERLSADLACSIHLPKTLNKIQLEHLVQLLTQTYQQIGWKVTRDNGYDQRNSTNWDYITIR